eukprot:6185988-Pleurochrysis_carterae.AAC.2
MHESLCLLPASAFPSRSVAAYPLISTRFALRPIVTCRSAKRTRSRARSSRAFQRTRWALP